MAQAAMIAETITGMKRALRRESGFSVADDSITQPTNRGNKLKANAKYVHEGALGFTNAEGLYKERVNHAGYTRYVLERNPPRYDSEGDELDDDDIDEDADAAAEEEDPFAGLALEHLLRPLVHPSELPHHPSMSQPYTSKALENMVEAVEAKLRHERALLWRAKAIHRQFLGDAPWVPCGSIETEEDIYIFDQGRPHGNHTTSQKTTGRNRSAPPSNDGSSKPTSANSVSNSHNETAGQATTGDVEMMDAPAQDRVVAENQTETAVDGVTTNSHDSVTAGDHSQRPNAGETENLPAATAEEDKAAQKEEAKGNDNGDRWSPAHGPDSNQEEQLDSRKEQIDDDREENDKEDELEDEADSDDDNSPPRRMTTRAQANNQGTDKPDPGSPSSISDAMDEDALASHPLFLLPPNTRADPTHGLPTGEADETRRLLYSYVQKQEETVRCFTEMLEYLLKVNRMKDSVWEWCKAEGHVGEMSDGEDWYDRERWGLAEGEDLKKGADEDEADGPVDEGRTTGKRGRGRRN